MEHTHFAIIATMGRRRDRDEHPIRGGLDAVRSLTDDPSAARGALTADAEANDRLLRSHREHERDAR
jgi:hypothetical protein